MDNDPQTTSGPQEQPDQERQNRRQFFNGLGKWSLAIIAAVTALREGLNDVQRAIGSRFETPSAAADDRRQRTAKKKVPHLNGAGGHKDHADHIEHGDSPAHPSPGGTIRVPGGPQDKIE
jgi:hypothetical protein